MCKDPLSQTFLPNLFCKVLRRLIYGGNGCKWYIAVKADLHLGSYIDVSSSGMIYFVEVLTFWLFFMLLVDNEDTAENSSSSSWEVQGVVTQCIEVPCLVVNLLPA